MSAHASDSESKLSPLARLAREADYDRFLVSLFAPGHKRTALFVLIAFNQEIARVRESVTEPMLGQIRLQWWREAVTEALAGTPRRHDVLEGLAAARESLSAALLEEMLAAREIELSIEPPATLDDFRAYAEGTSGALSEAMTTVLVGADEGSARTAARAVGTAYGMTGLLRAVRFQARRGRVMLPGKALEDAGTSAGAVRELRGEPGLGRVAERIAASAKAELERARALGSLPGEARPALLLGALTDAYLRRLAAKRFDVMNADLSLSPLRRQVAVALAALRKRI